jgi:AcrR family transcriptional regulator
MYRLGVMSGTSATWAAEEAGLEGPDVRRRRVRRSQLLDAAVDAVRSLGPTATMEQLARAGGVTKPILYRHFGDRDGLIGAIADRFSAGLIGSVSGALLASSHPRIVLDDTIDAYVRFLEQEPNVYRFLLQQPNARSEHSTPIGALVDAIAPQIAELTRAGLDRDGRDGSAAMPWAYGIVGLVHQSTNWWLRDRTMPRDQFVRHLTDLLWDGLRPR